MAKRQRLEYFIIFFGWIFSCNEIAFVLGEDGNDDQYNYNTIGGCDEDAISDSVPLSSMTPNQFVKICPQQLGSHVKLGQPICGDGTYFSFFFQKPLQRKANTDKILIEFMGGGACWSDETCQLAGDFVSFPQKFNNFVGYSCSEVAYALGGDNNDNNGGNDMNMLCAGSIGNTDFTEYNALIVPYCTQDIHIGDSVQYYDDGSVMNHKGGHNTMSVLRWLFRNFKSPKHIVLTGCSAGGTALPTAYDLIQKHYNGLGRRTVQISVLADSPVYLTPQYFLQNQFYKWNPSTMMSKVGFNYERWKYASDYPTRVWDHILRRGNNRDLWGFLTHNEDPTSLYFYEWMSGTYDDDDNGRQLGGEDDDGEYSEWWSYLMSSVKTVKSKHKNVQSYIIDGEGHCKFGLGMALNEDYYFEDWAASIFKEQKIGSNSPAIPLFLTSVVMGIFLYIGAFHARHKREIQLDDGGFLDEETKAKTRASARPCLASCVSCCSFAATYPITAAFTFALSIYFWTMIFSQGFVHPLNNPSLGPSAVSLSKFGINNPSLVLYESQSYRLFTSNLLCSGILTYLMVLQCLWYCVRPLEQLIRNSMNFSVINVILILGINFVYTIFGNGASCSSLAFVIGLSVVYVILRRRLEDISSMAIIVMVVFTTVITCVFFPFNSWIMLLSAILIGFLIATGVVRIITKEPLNMHGDGVIVSPASVMKVNPVKMNINGIVIAGAVLLLMIIISMIRLPNQMYLNPYYTGCDIRYTAGEDVSNLANNYANNGRRRRRVAEDDGNDYDLDNVCAQFCIPHLVSRGAVYGAQRFFSLSLTAGQCEYVGYDVHMADKTFNYFLDYSLDVEIFTTAEDEDDEKDDNKD
mmetsp:Transcript_20208/g.30629  ORF Transcript_20208/g.30629 Transcript_20208/m.30629 type:complete len:861 (-) Transcript_20208:61-2643(-)